VVTGARGFLGRRLVAELRARGDEVVAAVREGGELPSELDGVELVRGDLRRPPAELGAQLAEADALYHLAAGGSGGWRATFELVVGATERLLEAANDAGFAGRVVHVSSLAVYGLNSVPAGGSVDEDTPLETNPERRDDYAWAKLWQERVVRRMIPSERLVIVRPGAIYGPERRFQYRLGRELGERTVLLLGGRTPMPLTYVDNTASLIAECGRSEAAVGEVFNSIDPWPLTQRDYVRRWRSARADAPRAVPLPLLAHRAAGRALVVARRLTGGRLGPPSFLDPYVMEPSLRSLRFVTDKPARLLGWSPPVRLEDALRRTFEEPSEQLDEPR